MTETVIYEVTAKRILISYIYYKEKLRFFRGVRFLVMLYSCIKCLENILNGFQITEWTQRGVIPKKYKDELRFLHVDA